MKLLIAAFGVDLTMLLALQAPPTPPLAHEPRMALIRFEARPARRAFEREVSFEEIEKLWIVSRANGSAYVHDEVDGAFGRVVGTVRGQGKDEIVGVVSGGVTFSRYGERIERLLGLDPNAAAGSKRLVEQVFHRVRSVESFGDLDGDGEEEVAIGFDARWRSGRVRILRGARRASSGLITKWTGFGEIGGIARLGDMDGDGAPELAVGDPLRDLVAILSPRRRQPVAYLRPAADPWTYFGSSVAAGADLDADGATELAVGATEAWSDLADARTDPSVGRGSVYVYSGRDWSLRSILRGDSRAAYFGAGVAWCDDLDDDSNAELAITAPWDGNGRVFVVSEATGGLVRGLEGVRSGFRYGKSLDVSSDLDGDGTRDLVIGAPRADDARDASTGYVDLICGRTGTLLLRIEGPRSSESPVDPWGESHVAQFGWPADYSWPRNDAFGWTVATGDFDGDAVSDLAIGFPCRAPGSVVGYVAAISGTELRLRMREEREMQLEPATSGVESTATPGIGIPEIPLLWSIEAFHESTFWCEDVPCIGHAIECVGDTDGDDREELVAINSHNRADGERLSIVGKGVLERVRIPKGFVMTAHRCVARVAPSKPNAPSAFVIGLGVDPGMDCGSQGEVDGYFGGVRTRLPRPYPTGLCGDGYAGAIADAGDLDGDGFHELAVASTGLPSRVHLLAGAGGTPIAEIPIATDKDIEDLMLAAGRDLDRDGLADIVVGEPSGQLDPRRGGSISIYSGRTRGLIARALAPEKGMGFASALELVDDVDGDGTCELAIGAPSASDGRGEVWLLSGASLEPLRVWRGHQVGVGLGWALDAANDLDGDGTDDLVVSAPAARRQQERFVVVMDPRSGRILSRINAPAPGERELITGREWTPAVPRPSRFSYAFGCAVATGDFDGDGLADLAIGAPEIGSNPCGGRVCAISGAELRKYVARSR